MPLSPMSSCLCVWHQINPFVESLDYRPREGASFSAPRNKARNSYATERRRRFRKNRNHTAKAPARQVSARAVSATVIASNTIIRMRLLQEDPIIRLLRTRKAARIITVSYVLGSVMCFHHHSSYRQINPCALAWTLEQTNQNVGRFGSG
jgi:hypothetical protein